MKKEEMQELIKKADVVFLNGGDPNIQLEIIKNNNLSESIRNTKAIVIGMSAGAMCMSKYSWMLPCNEEYPKMDIRNGMNLSELSIYPHYNTDGKILDSYTNGDETTLKEDIIKSVEEYGPVYLLPDSSAIIERNDEILFVGPNIIFVDRNKVEVINEDSSTMQL
jgi:cyanophycinase